MPSRESRTVPSERGEEARRDVVVRERLPPPKDLFPFPARHSCGPLGASRRLAHDGCQDRGEPIAVDVADLGSRGLREVGRGTEREREKEFGIERVQYRGYRYG